MGETLAEHTWEILSRLAELARLRPGLPDEISRPNLWHLLFWTAFLHDWGKAAHSFQAVLRGKTRRWPHRHEVLSLAFVDWVSTDWEEEEVIWLAASIASHHKDLAEIESLYPTDLDEEDDPFVGLVQELDETTVYGLWRWLTEIAPAWVAELGMDRFGVSLPHPPPGDEATAHVLEYGASITSRWLDRCLRLVDDLSWDPDTPRRLMGILLRGYLVQADHTASAHAGTFKPAPIVRQSVLAAADIGMEQLYEHQRRAASTEGSALLVAPTGSGKTEAALLWAARQAESRGEIPRLFYTLPYQASMNAMYDRLHRSFAGHVGLLHGRAMLALYRRYMDQGYTPQESTRLARTTRDLVRLYVPPIQVFSPYQMLKAAYQLKGYETMWANYAQAAFIFDEIHAYEPKRLALILETVAYLREHLGARFLVMSATLPAPVRQRVAQALGDPIRISAAPSLFQMFTRHQVRILPGELLDDHGLDAIVETFQAGRSVLVTCNTVARAQAAHQALIDRLPQTRPGDIILIHGRFNARDRLVKEQGILEATALHQHPKRPVLVVSTQVVEVSLNIDLDTIFTDPAPLEALVQRFGRVNRGRRMPIAPVHIFEQPDDGQHIYDPAMVQAALDILTREAAGRSLNEGLVQTWLDETYTGDVLLQWEQQYAQAAGEFRRISLDQLHPFRSDPALEDAFYKLFDGLEVLPQGLVDAYEAHLEDDDPLAASQLLVPISWGRYHALANEGRIRPAGDGLPPIVEAYYDSEIGLDPEREPENEEEWL